MEDNNNFEKEIDRLLDDARGLEMEFSLVISERQKETLAESYLALCRWIERIVVQHQPPVEAVILSPIPSDDHPTDSVIRFGVSSIERQAGVDHVLARRTYFEEFLTLREKPN